MASESISNPYQIAENRAVSRARGGDAVRASSRNFPDKQAASQAAEPIARTIEGQDREPFLLGVDKLNDNTKYIMVTGNPNV